MLIILDKNFRGEWARCHWSRERRGSSAWRSLRAPPGTWSTAAPSLSRCACLQKILFTILVEKYLLLLVWKISTNRFLHLQPDPDASGEVGVSHELDGCHLLVVDAHDVLAELEVLLVHLLLGELVEVRHGAGLEAGPPPVVAQGPRLRLPHTRAPVNMNKDVGYFRHLKTSRL